MPVPQRLTPIEPSTKGASWTLVEEDHGRVFQADAVDLVATLPAVTASNAGLTFHFSVLTASATTGFSISPNASDNIDGGTDDKDLINTAATDAVGDCVSVVSNGSTGWVTFGRNGTWAAEA